MPREDGCTCERGFRKRQRRRGKFGGNGADGIQNSILDCSADQEILISRVPCYLSCAQRLRELGIFEGARVTVIRCSDPVLLLVKDSRIAIDRRTAVEIEVYNEQ